MNANEREELDIIVERVGRCHVRGVECESQPEIHISYKGFEVGRYLADIIVEQRLLVELKCVDQFANEHIAQCINYLRASGLKLALLVNFQEPKVIWKRIVLGL
jgi:GxxExxY protein